MARKKKSEPSFVIRSLLICDDIRQERNGKEIIIGVYTGAIIFPKLPAKLNRVLFRIDVQFLKRVKDFVFQIRDEKNELKFETKGKLPEDRPVAAGIFVFELGQIEI